MTSFKKREWRFSEKGLLLGTSTIPSPSHEERGGSRKKGTPNALSYLSFNCKSAISCSIHSSRSYEDYTASVSVSYGVTYTKLYAQPSGSSGFY